MTIKTKYVDYEKIEKDKFYLVEKEPCKCIKAKHNKWEGQSDYSFKSLKTGEISEMTDIGAAYTRFIEIRKEENPEYFL